MKYVRKAIVIILAAIFLAAVAIGASVILAVRNINVAAVSYSSDAGDSTEFTSSVNEIKSSLSSISGKNILGIDEDDVNALIPQDGYARLVSVEKVYPCTVNVTVEERLETFASLNEDGSYDIYDESGEYITTKDNNVNNLDGCPNVVADGDVAEIATVAAYFNQNFSALRSVAESVTITEYSVDNGDVLAFKLYCGITLRLVDYTEYTQEKVAALYSAFESLEDYDKTQGEISCHSDAGGNLYVTLPDGSISRV